MWHRVERRCWVMAGCSKLWTVMPKPAVKLPIQVAALWSLHSAAQPEGTIVTCAPNLWPFCLLHIVDLHSFSATCRAGCGLALEYTDCVTGLGRKTAQTGQAPSEGSEAAVARVAEGRASTVHSPRVVRLFVIHIVELTVSAGGCIKQRALTRRAQRM